MDTGFSGLRHRVVGGCSVHASWYEDRYRFWNQNEQAFYEYVHSWFQNWGGDRCGWSNMRPDSFAVKKVAETNHMALREVSSYRGSMLWRFTTDGQITGLEQAKITFDARADQGSNQRVEDMKRLQDMLEAHRASRPDRWGEKNVDTVGANIIIPGRKTSGAVRQSVCADRPAFISPEITID